VNKNKTAWPVFKLILGCFFLVLMPLQAAARDHPCGQCELIPETWMPSLEQVKDYLDESSKAEVQAPQQTLNRMSQNLADISDAQLFIVYIQLIQTLEAQEQAGLFEEQKRWLGKRAESVQAAVISKGGSLAPLEYNSVFKKITEERLAELQKRLQQPLNINSSKK